MSAHLLDAWQSTLRRFQDDRAVVQAADGTTVTFGELEARSEQWLRTQGVAAADLQGRAVVFAVANGIPWLEIFLGLIKAGAIAVPLDATEPAGAQHRMAETLHAGFWWNGKNLIALPDARRFRDSSACLIKLTSGSTGNPQAHTFTDRQMLADGAQITSTMGITRQDLNYALIPLGHSYGLGNLTLPLLAQGIPLVCGTAPLPHAIAADFVRWRPTVFPGVPALWRAIASSGVELPGLRLGISAGAPLPPEVARDFAARFGQRLHGFYGSSETGGIAYDRTGAGTLKGQVGRALHGVVLTPLSGSRLQVCSPAVFTHGNRSQRGKPGAWIMPDRATVDALGRITLLGRRDTTVKISGRRLNLAEVAGRLRQLPGVREAWVGASADPEPVLGAVVASERPAASLRTELLADTAPWKVPKRIVVVSALPVTPRGKIDARALQALAFPLSAER